MAIKIAGTEVINDNRELVLAKLTEINSSISSTAVDVFIYDTSKDSDGGAWRHRTQHTSWYAEASSASRDVNTRSTRAEFPAVAVIVAESNKVTIYDGDDPSLPMWMVFQGDSANGLSMMAERAFGTYIAALNGELAAACPQFDAYRIRFVADDGFQYGNTPAISGKYKGNISQRNDLLGYNTGIGVPQLVSRNCNDVAMTVLPDAPTDPATGLPVPTIAIATDGYSNYSTSIITDSGDVYDIASNSTGTAVSVAFDGVSLIVVRSDGTVYVWDNAGGITADGASPDATYSTSSTPTLLGAVSEVAA